MELVLNLENTTFDLERLQKIEKAQSMLTEYLDTLLVVRMEHRLPQSN